MTRILAWLVGTVVVAILSLWGTIVLLAEYGGEVVDVRIGGLTTRRYGLALIHGLVLRHDMVDAVPIRLDARPATGVLAHSPGPEPD